MKFDHKKFAESLEKKISDIQSEIDNLKTVQQYHLRLAEQQPQTVIHCDIDTYEIVSNSNEA